MMLERLWTANRQEVTDYGPKAGDRFQSTVPVEDVMEQLILLLQKVAENRSW